MNEPSVNVLIVDDNPQNLTVISTLLDGFGYNLIRAQSGTAALRQLLDKEFAVVLLDVVMPILDGFETAKLIRARDKTRCIPIIFTSAFSTDEASISNGYDLGAVDYMLSPLVPEILKAKVSAFVELYRKNEQIRQQTLALNEGHLREQYLIREKLLEAQNSKRLEHQAQLLSQSNSDLERFAHVLCHDLQEPLNTISSFSQLLEQELTDSLGADTREYLRCITTGTQRMRNLIRSLLNYSKVKDETRAPAHVDLSPVVTAVKESLSSLIQETKATVEVSELPVVMGDPSLLSQVFQNLLSNAIKFRGTNPPQIVISATQQTDVWEFCMSDNGIGIDPQYFDQVFVMFKRLHSQDQYQGTGMGLALCKRIIEGYGGKIWVESEPGSGSKFFFTLPVAAAQKAVA